MTTSELLLRAARAGVVFWLEDDRLAYRAPTLAMTEELRGEIIRHKADLVAMLRNNRINAPLPAAPDREEDTSPLASGQERLWLIDRRIGPSPLYNIHFRLLWQGVLDRAALALAIKDVVARHPALRTTFSESDETVMARVSSNDSDDATELVHLDLRDKDAASKARAADEFIADQQRAPFDLERGPLMRAAVVTLSRDDHIVLVTHHHIVTDGWSLRIFLSELGQCYMARYRGEPTPRPEVSFSYFDFVRWESQMRREESYAERLRWWKEHLSGLPPLILGRQRSVPDGPEDHRGAVREFSVPAVLATRLVDLARSQGCTLYTLLLTAWSILLYRYTRQTDFAVGTVTSGRDRAEFQHILGFFANTTVFRCNLSGNPDVSESISRMHAETRSVFEHEIPFADTIMAVGAVQDTGLTPLVQAAFMFPNFEEPEFLGADDAGKIDATVTVSARIDGSIEGTAKFDFMLTMQESDGDISGCLEYATARFSSAAAEQMTKHLLVLLDSMAEDPAKPIGRLKMMNQQERQQLLVEWNKKR